MMNHTNYWFYENKNDNRIRFCRKCKDEINIEHIKNEIKREKYLIEYKNQQLIAKEKYFEYYRKYYGITPDYFKNKDYKHQYKFREFHSFY